MCVLEVSTDRSTEYVRLGRSGPQPGAVRVAEHLCAVHAGADEPADIAEDVLEMCRELGAIGVLIILVDERGVVVSVGAGGASNNFMFSSNPHVVAEQIGRAHV